MTMMRFENVVMVYADRAIQRIVEMFRKNPSLQAGEELHHIPHTHYRLTVRIEREAVIELTDKHGLGEEK